MTKLGKPTHIYTGYGELRGRNDLLNTQDLASEHFLESWI